MMNVPVIALAFFQTVTLHRCFVVEMGRGVVQKGKNHTRKLQCELKIKNSITKNNQYTLYKTGCFFFFSNIWFNNNFPFEAYKKHNLFFYSVHVLACLH